MTTRGDRKTFRNEDLVLKVTPNIDPSVWDETKYEGFLDELCGTREYQKEAIRTTLGYLVGGKYADLRALARENFDANDEIQQRYGSWAGMSGTCNSPTNSLAPSTRPGTCYVGDEYFADVVHRYSLRQAIEERFVKRVEYVAEMPETDNPEEKWQLIYDRHQDWKKKLKRRNIRPLTIIVTLAVVKVKLGLNSRGTISSLVFQ
jgi:hypothetical protein